MLPTRAQLADPTYQVSDSDYDAIVSAIMETARGRWFLSEYARRNRHADTQLLVGAIDRMKETLDLYGRTIRPYQIKTTVSSADASQRASDSGATSDTFDFKALKNCA